MGIYPGHAPMNLARLLEHKHIITRQCFENLSEYLSVSLNITYEDCSIKQNIFFYNNQLTSIFVCNTKGNLRDEKRARRTVNLSPVIGITKNNNDMTSIPF